MAKTRVRPRVLAQVERNTCNRFIKEVKSYIADEFASLERLNKRQAVVVRRRLTKTIEWILLYDKRVELVEQRLSMSFDSVVELLSDWTMEKEDDIVVRYYAIPYEGAVPVGPFSTRHLAVKHLPPDVRKSFYGDARVAPLGKPLKPVC